MHLTAYWASPVELGWVMSLCAENACGKRRRGAFHAEGDTNLLERGDRLAFDSLYFLNRLLKASRASLALRGVDCCDASGRDPFWPFPLGSPSRATVTLGEKRLH